jgi:hypothetical protein
LPIFERKHADKFWWRRDEILARGKNRGKRIGENKGVRRFSLFYSSPGAGYAPRDVRRKNI